MKQYRSYYSLKEQRPLVSLAERIKTKRLLLMVFLSLFLAPYSSVLAKKVQAKAVPSTEQRQQFTYYWYAARQAINDERYVDAYALLQFCHALDPDDAQTLAFLGMMQEAIGHQEQAAEAFKRAYETDPANHWRNYLEPLKKQYIERKEWKKALATQDEIDRRKGEYDAYSALARCSIYAQMNKPKKAVAAIDKYLKTDPTNLRFLLLRLDLAEKTKAKPKELYALYERILELDPYNLLVLNNYAYLLATKGGDLTKAEQMSQLTIREEPNNPVYLDTYGWIMHLKGQNELALFYLNKALWNADERTKAEVEKHIKEIER